MSFENLSYLMTILIFAGSAILIEWGLAFRRLKKYTKIIGIVVGIGIVYSLIAEWVALRWKAWYYLPDQNFGIYIFNVPLETLIFSLFVSVAVASATLVWSDYEEKRKPLIKSSVDKIKIKLKNVFRFE